MSLGSGDRAAWLPLSRPRYTRWLKPMAISCVGKFSARFVTVTCPHFSDDRAPILLLDDAYTMTDREIEQR